jgi:hypothetical protein
MNVKRLSLATALCAALIAGNAGAVDTARNGAVATPANRIVGLWISEGATRPCGSGLALNVTRNTLLFAAGGTVEENARFPPQGAANANGVPGMNQRTQALGTWSYEPTSGVYSLHLRFDWYVDGVYHGYQTVDRDMTLSPDGMQVTGPVAATRFNAAGVPIAALCGTAVSDRI